MIFFASLLASLELSSSFAQAPSAAGNFTPPSTDQTPGSAEPPPQPINESMPPQSNSYPPGPDSQPQPGIPPGKTIKVDLPPSTVFPNTTQSVYVYVPAAYEGDKPACVYIGLDGLGFRATTVFDNLIAQHAMPVTIAIGLPPGLVPSTPVPDHPRFERSLEFDSMTDRLARFILEEVLPAVEKQTAPNGKPILLSHDGNDRAVAGGSTGGIGAFNLAWSRPDAFSRVFTSVGTFVGMRGGERFYVEVRKTEPKPIRVFMQDGVHDEQRDVGDWWMANQTMERALKFSGIQVNHAWGVGTHNPKHAESIFPDAMRWLWQDWPKPIAAGLSGNSTLRAVLVPHESWKAVADAAKPSHLAVDPQGRVYYSEQGKTFTLGADGKVEPSSPTDEVLALGPDGKTYSSHAVDSLAVSEMTVRNHGDIYATTKNTNGDDEIWLVKSNGEKKRLDGNIRGAAGLAFSPDGLWLFVVQNRSRWGLSYRVLPDGTLDSREAFYDFWVPDWADDSGGG